MCIPIELPSVKYVIVFLLLTIGPVVISAANYILGAGSCVASRLGPDLVVRLRSSERCHKDPLTTGLLDPLFGFVRIIMFIQIRYENIGTLAREGDCDR